MSLPTSHANPVYTEYDLFYYCATNMSGAVAQTSTFVLNDATMPYTLKLANMDGE